MDAPRRIIFSNVPPEGASGEPTVRIIDENIEAQWGFNNTLAKYVVAQDEVPFTNDSDVKTDVIDLYDVVVQNGANIFYWDIMPGGKVPWHRTTSTDISVIVTGEVHLSTPDGPWDIDDGKGTWKKTKQKICKSGDSIVMRGVIHAWENKSDKPVRIWSVTLDAKEQQFPTGPVRQVQKLEDSTFMMEK